MFSANMVVLLVVASLLSSVETLPVKREVPQEHSHQRFLVKVQALLQKNNHDQIVDSIFGLLGNAAAAGGQGKITDTDCLQQATADQAFSNAKAEGDIAGMSAALIYRALERNTAKVGLASAMCTSLKAVNPEIAAVQQHQDPASPNASAMNKAVTLALAQQLASIGGNPQDALQSGTFSPGNLSDSTGRGNTCDDPNDVAGCIYTQNLLVEDVSPQEINSAVENVSASLVPSGATPSSISTSSGTLNPVSELPTVSTASAAASSSVAAVNGNLQTFMGTLGGPPPAVTRGGRGFVVHGSDDFINISAALQRSCDIQHNTCADAANSGHGFSVGQCDQQETACVVVGKMSSSTGSSSVTTNTVPSAISTLSTAATSSPSPSNSSGNLQTFMGSLGGLPPPVNKGGRGFIVQGSSFLNIGAALQRSCDIQHNTCADAANSGAGFSVGQCDQQNTACAAARKP